MTSISFNSNLFLKPEISWRQVSLTPQSVPRVYHPLQPAADLWVPITSPRLQQRDITLTFGEKSHVKIRRRDFLLYGGLIGTAVVLMIANVVEHSSPPDTTPSEYVSQHNLGFDMNTTFRDSGVDDWSSSQQIYKLYSNDTWGTHYSLIRNEKKSNGRIAGIAGYGLADGPSKGAIKIGNVTVAQLGKDGTIMAVLYMDQIGQPVQNINGDTFDPKKINVPPILIPVGKVTDKDNNLYLSIPGTPEIMKPIATFNQNEEYFSLSSKEDLKLISKAAIAVLTTWQLFNSGQISYIENLYRQHNLPAQYLKDWKDQVLKMTTPIDRLDGYEGLQTYYSKYIKENLQQDKNHVEISRYSIPDDTVRLVQQLSGREGQLLRAGLLLGLITAPDLQNAGHLAEMLDDFSEKTKHWHHFTRRTFLSLRGSG